MSLDFKKLIRRKEGFLVDDTADVYIDGGVLSANDMACLGAWFEISNATAGLGASPGTVTLEYTPDDGTTWVTVPGMIGGSITGDGSDFNLQASATTGVFPPIIRFKFVAPAGQSYRVAHIRRNYCTPGLVASLRSSIASVTGFGAVTNAPRSAAMLGSIDKAPTPSTTGYQYVTSTGFTKTLAGDGRALDVNISAASFTQKIVNYNGTDIIPVFSSGTPANNKGMPVIFTAGDALAPVAMGSGADSVLTLRTTLSTRHEAVATPLTNKLSDGTNALGLFDNVLVGAQYQALGAYRLPTASILMAWNGTNHKELKSNSSDQLQVEVANTITANKLEWSKAIIPLYWSFAGATIYSVTGAALVATTWLQIIASTGAKVLKIGWWNPTGEIIEIGFGAGGAEVSQGIITIGDGSKELLIPLGTRVSLRCTNAVASGVLVMEFLT